MSDCGVGVAYDAQIASKEINDRIQNFSISCGTYNCYLLDHLAFYLFAMIKLMHAGWLREAVDKLITNCKNKFVVQLINGSKSRKFIIIHKNTSIIIDHI